MITNQACFFVYLYILAQIYAILQVFQLTKVNAIIQSFIKIGPHHQLFLENVPNFSEHLLSYKIPGRLLLNLRMTHAD